MAVYSKLLLSAGGGIISTQQQADQVKNTASVLIGLGGTGIDCLRTIKTQLHSRLKADDPDAAVPTYSHIRFLGVDTSERAKGNPQPRYEATKADDLLSLDDTEFFNIGNQDLKKAFGTPRALQQRPEISWLRWGDDYVPDLCNTSVGGIRQVGRYMMMDKSNLFISRIEREIEAAKAGLSSPDVNIHIISGLSGGTGSGCFLDVCYMVRYVALRTGGANIFGYFFLPDVNLTKIPKDDINTRSYIPKNGYAAMQELDYCMQLQYNGGGFVQEYQGHKMIEWKQPPVDMCHLIGATHPADCIIPNAYVHAMNVTAEYIMSFLIGSDGKYGLAEHLCNFLQRIRTADYQKTIGSNLAYCTLGGSCASIPLREINTYLASDLFDRFSSISSNVPSQQDVEALAIASLARDAGSISDIYNSLFREAREGTGDDYSPYTDDRKFVRDYDNSDLITHYTNQTAAKLNRIEANTNSMMTVTNQESLFGRVQAQLSSILRDINRGPIFAYKLLSAAESHNLLNIIDGLKYENKSRWNQEAAQTELRTRDYEGAKADFDNRRGLIYINKKRFNDYEWYLMLFEQHKLAMNTYEMMDKVLSEFRKQIENVTANYYIKLSRVMDTLINTFEENRNALASREFLQVTDSFELPMMTIAELKKSLNEEIKKINILGMLDSFMSLLLDNEDEWILEDENKITKLITKFFVETAFKGFANRTITSFLADKYGTDNVALLSDYIYEDWIKLLTTKANPLFCFNDTIWRESSTSKIAYLSVPTTSAPIKAAAQKMCNTNSLWQINCSTLTDRIYAMCIDCALPLCSNSSCNDYEKVAFSTSAVGRYYYEGKPVQGMTFDDWRKLPPLTPQSMVELEKVPYAVRDIITSGQKLYDEAEPKGVFDDNNHICKPNADAVADVRKLASQCIEIADKISRVDEIESAKQVLSQLVVLSEAIPMIPTEFAMRNDGYVYKSEIKNRVKKDYFVSSPAYQSMVRDILKEIDDVELVVSDAREKLQAKINEIEASI